MLKHVFHPNPDLNTPYNPDLNTPYNLVLYIILFCYAILFISNRSLM